MKRAVYDKQFKIAAVKMAQAGDQSVLNVAKEIGVSASSLRRWINEYDTYGTSAFPGLNSTPFVRQYDIILLTKGVLCYA